MQDPALAALSYLLMRARMRFQSIRDGHPETGAVTLEWIVIAGILLAAAIAAGAIFRAAVSRYTHKLK